MKNTKEIQLDEKQEKQKLKQQKQLCVVNNVIIFAATIMTFILFFLGVNSSDGSLITIYTFHNYLLNLFKSSWSSVYVVLNLLYDAGMAVAYVIVFIKLVIAIVKSIIELSSIIEKGYDRTKQNFIKATLSNTIFAVICFQIISAMYYPQQAMPITVLMIVLAYCVFIVSDILSFYYSGNNKYGFKFVLYEIIKELVVVIVFALSYIIIVRFACIYEFINNIKLYISLNTYFGSDGLRVFSTVIQFFIIPIVYFIFQCMYLSTIKDTTEMCLSSENSAFVKLIVCPIVICCLYVFATLLVTPNSVDNIFTYVLENLSFLAALIIMFLGGHFAYYANKTAKEQIIEEYNKKEQSKLVVAQEHDEREQIDEEEQRRDENQDIAKMIAAAIVEEQKEAKLKDQAEDMAKIINAAVKKISKAKAKGSKNKLSDGNEK